VTILLDHARGEWAANNDPLALRQVLAAIQDVFKAFVAR
jgi:hypothetical protein